MSDEMIEIAVEIVRTVELTTEKGSVSASVEIVTEQEFEVTL